ncbi:MAG: DinB family protein, partial [Planctomycetota bacterium]
ARVTARRSEQERQMVIGRLEPGQAQQTDLKSACYIGLEEATTALEESFHDLTDEQISRQVFPDRHNICTLVMHCLHNLDVYACRFQGGATCLAHDEQFDVWHHSPAELAETQHDLPGVEEILRQLRRLRQAILYAIERASEAELRGARYAESWWTDQGRTAADAYMRTIYHTMAHVRQIWLMRGAMGLTDSDGWPEQHWA